MVSAYVRTQVPLARLTRKADSGEAVESSTAAKKKPERQMVWAEVYAPNRPDVDGEFMTEEDIFGLHLRFMQAGDIHRFDIQHNGKIQKGLYLVESFIARPGDPDFIPGSWVVGMYVENKLIWQKIKRGELNGFSVEALVVKKPTDVNVEIPDVVTGTTSTAEDGHSHVFAVKYDKSGKFLGGSTSFVNGHAHRILAGTVTQRTEDHVHRFSAVDSVTVSEA